MCYLSQLSRHHVERREYSREGLYRRAIPSHTGVGKGATDWLSRLSISQRRWKGLLVHYDTKSNTYALLQTEFYMYIKTLSRRRYHLKPIAGTCTNEPRQQTNGFVDAFCRTHTITDTTPTFGVKECVHETTTGTRKSSL